MCTVEFSIRRSCELPTSGNKSERSIVEKAESDQNAYFVGNSPKAQCWGKTKQNKLGLALFILVFLLTVVTF